MCFYYEPTCSCTGSAQLHAARKWLVLVIVRVRIQALLLLGDPENPKELIRRPLCRHRGQFDKKKVVVSSRELNLHVGLYIHLYIYPASFRVSVTVVNSVCWPKRKV